MPLSSALSQLHIHGVAYIALTDNTDILSEMFPTELTGIHSHFEKIPVVYHQTYTILQGLHIPPINGFLQFFMPQDQQTPSPAGIW